MDVVQLSPEQCEEKVSEIVPTLSLVDLTNLCLELGLNIDDGIKGERLKVLKFVNKYLVNLEDEEAKAKYTQVYGYFKANQIKVEEEESKNVDEQKKQSFGKQSPSPQSTVDFSQFLSGLTDALKESGGNKKQSDLIASLLQQQMLGNVTPEPPKQPGNSTPLKPAMVMKELKFKGTIGGEGKDSLTFSSLCYQIRNAQKIGYQEPAICDAMLTAIAPSNHLKMIFEMRPTLSVTSMLGKLKHFYKEKDHTNTLTELTHTAQGSQESCLEYCTRLMCLRDKVILLSIEEGCPQDLNGLSKTFLKSVFLGMRNGNVRNELRESCKSLYKDPKEAEKDDNELMSLISEAMANEKARAERLKEAKEVEVNMMHANTENKKKRSVSFSESKDKPSPLAQIAELREKQDSQNDTLTALVAQVMEIKDVLVGGDRSNKTVPSVPSKPAQPAPVPSLMQPLLNPSAAPQPSQAYQPPLNQPSLNQPSFQPRQPQGGVYVPPHRRGFCQRCTIENRLRCFHCFYCGKDSHRAFECPEKN